MYIDSQSELGPGAKYDNLDAKTDGAKESGEKFTNKYKALRVRNQTIEGGREWTDEYLLSEYVHITDGLIGKLDGTIPLDGSEKDSDKELDPPSSVLWLDKSARPVSWLKRKLWSTMARRPGTRYDEYDIPLQPQDYY